MDDTSEARAIYKALEPMIKATIKKETRNCVRSRKMVVTVVPDGTVIGVEEAYGKTIYIPYVSTLSSVTVGTSVRVTWYCDDASTMIATSLGSGK